MTDLRGEGGLRPAQQRGEHLAGLVGVVVDGLLAEDDELRAFLSRHGLEQLGHGQRLQFDVGLDQDGAVGADGQRRAQGFLAGGTPQETAITSVAMPASFSRTPPRRRSRRRGSSTS
jgi:hypothetical protein